MRHLYILALFKTLPHEFKKALIFLYFRDENFRKIMSIAYDDREKNKLN